MAMMRDDLQTTSTPFGQISHGPEAEIAFPHGLPGFPQVTRFVLTPLPGAAAPLQLLHGVGEPPVNLVMVPLESVQAQVASTETDAVRESLDIPAADLLVLCIVTLARRGAAEAPRLNLRAPIFVDVARRRAFQVVLPNTAYSFRQPVSVG